MLKRLKSWVVKYSEVVAFGGAFGVSMYLCAASSASQCVSLLTLITNSAI